MQKRKVVPVFMEMKDIEKIVSNKYCMLHTLRHEDI